MIDFEGDLGMLGPWIHHNGVAAVFVILTLESFGIPLPGESLLIVAAMLSSRGEFSVVSLFLSAWTGAVLGDNIGYLIGRSLGRDLLLRYGARVGLNAQRVSRIETVFTHYGPAAVGFSRFIGVLRQLNGIVAGTVKMNWWRFLIFNALGGALWVLVWILVGHYFGAHVADAIRFMHECGIWGVILVCVVAVALLAYIFRYRISRMWRQDNIR